MKQGDGGASAPVAWDRLFNPRGIAVVGASADLRRIGGQPVKFLSSYGYPGHVIPVNPHRERIAGLRCYATVDAIDLPCDVALIAVNARAAVEAVRACGRQGVGFAVILSSGFREIGEEGVALEDELLAAAREHGVRLIGPNCLGYLNLENRIYATFGVLGLEPELRQGAVSMVSQSGGFGFSVVTLAESAGVGFRHIVSSGNESDLGTPDLLAGFVDDPGTRLLLASIEGVRDGRALMRVAARSNKAGKPLFMWKTGNSWVGKQASLSHTANLTGDHAVYRAAFRQAGILEVRDIDEITDKARAFLAGRLPRGPRVAAMGSSAGSCILFADRCAELGLDLPELSRETEDELRRILPAFGSPRNPVDVTADIYNDVETFDRALDAVLADPHVDQLAVLFAGLSGELAHRCVQAVAGAFQRHDKPVMLGWSARRHRAEAAYAAADEAGIPYFSSPARLAAAAAALADFAACRQRARTRELFPSAGEAFAPVGLDLEGTLSESAAKAILASWGMPHTRDVMLGDGEDDLGRCGCLRFPLAVKILSADIAHKTEAGGVILGVGDLQQLRTAVDTVRRNAKRHDPGARIEGVLVSEMVTGAVEMLLGIVTDPVFGPVVVLGLGGVQAELLQDVTHRIAPFGEDTALEMISELRGAPLLRGYRGRPAGDVPALAGAVARLSQAAWQHRDRVVELDINPLFVFPQGQGVMAGDALIVLRPVDGGS